MDISIVDLGVKDLFHFKLIMALNFYGWWFGWVAITNLILMVGDEFGSVEYRMDLVLMGELELEIDWPYLLNNVIWTKVLG